MHVLHLIASNFAGGPEKQIVELSSRLVEHGWPVRIGSFAEGRDHVEILERAKERGLETFTIDTANSFSPTAVGQLRDQISSFRADLLITHGYKANTVGMLASRGSEVLQLPVVRGFTFEDWKVRLYERIDRFVLRRASAMIAVSAATGRMLEGHGIAADRIHVVHNSVDCTQTVSPLDIQDTFGLDGEFKVVVAAGRLSPEKGHRFLVDAMAELRDSNPAVCLVILGEGRERAALEKQVADQNLADRVLLPGFRQDVLRCLAGADLVVNPSLSEGLPNVVLEAMAVGTAVAATDVGGVAELIPDPSRGWLVESASSRALADALGKALADDQERERRAAAGQELVRAQFSFEEQRRRFCEVCEHLTAATC